MAAMLYDLRLALRGLLWARSLTLLSIATIALGCGLATGIFSVVNAVLFRPLPYSHPDRLVAVGKIWGNQTGPAGASEPEVLDWRERSRSFEAIEFWDRRHFAASDELGLRAVSGAAVSSGFLDLLGVRMLRGRTFASEGRGVADRSLAIISEKLWRSGFGGDESIVGQRLALGGFGAQVGGSYEIIGVLPADVAIDYGTPVDVMAHVLSDGRRATGARRTASLQTVARLKPGVSIEAAGAEMRELAIALNREYPMGIPDAGIAVAPLHQYLTGGSRRISHTLLAAVGIVLLVAVVNVCGLLLTRNQRRSREIAVRIAIRAGRSRLLGLILGEAAILALAGGLAAIVLGLWTANVFVSLAPLLFEMAPTDPRGLAIAVVTMLLVGLVAAWQPARTAAAVDPMVALRAE